MRTTVVGKCPKHAKPFLNQKKMKSCPIMRRWWCWWDPLHCDVLFWNLFLCVCVCACGYGHTCVYVRVDFDRERSAWTLESAPASTTWPCAPTTNRPAPPETTDTKSMWVCQLSFSLVQPWLVVCLIFPIPDCILCLWCCLNLSIHFRFPFFVIIFCCFAFLFSSFALLFWSNLGS